MKHTTKKPATVKNAFLEIRKIYAIGFILSKYETIKKNFDLFKLVIENSSMNFIRTLPIAIYLIANFSKLSLTVVTSKNKRVIVLTLLGNKKDYSFIAKKLWTKFLDNFNKDNKLSKNKIDNNGFYTFANSYYYNAKELQLTTFKFQLLVLKNSASKKDFLEVKNSLLASYTDQDLKLNKQRLYLNDNSDLKIYSSYNDCMFKKGKSYFLPLIDPILLSLANLYNLTYSISDKNLTVETKKDTKKKIQSTKKLLKVSKKIQKKNSKKVNKKK